jgi:hypothetical protein
MKIIDCEQGTPEWFAARLSIPTASHFKDIVTSKGDKSKSQDKYLRKCVAEWLSGSSIETYQSANMKIGNLREPEARQHYEFIYDVDVKQIGFCVLNDGSAGYSPDGFVGDDGLIEIKCRIETVMVEHYLNGMPTTCVQQCQGGIWITEREWCDYYAYNPAMKPFHLRIYRDDKFIEKLSNEVARFNDKLNDMKEKLKGWKK